MISGHTGMAFTHLEMIFMCRIKYGSNFILYTWKFNLLSAIYLKIIHLPLFPLGDFVENELNYKCFV
jgi:hypothetical protein